MRSISVLKVNFDKNLKNHSRFKTYKLNCPLCNILTFQLRAYDSVNYVGLFVFYNNKRNKNYKKKKQLVPRVGRAGVSWGEVRERGKLNL